LLLISSKYGINWSETELSKKMNLNLNQNLNQLIAKSDMSIDKIESDKEDLSSSSSWWPTLNITENIYTLTGSLRNSFRSKPKVLDISSPISSEHIGHIGLNPNTGEIESKNVPNEWSDMFVGLNSKLKDMGKRGLSKKEITLLLQMGIDNQNPPQLEENSSTTNEQEEHGISVIDHLDQNPPQLEENKSTQIEFISIDINELNNIIEENNQLKSYQNDLLLRLDNERRLRDVFEQKYRDLNLEYTAFCNNSNDVVITKINSIRNNYEKEIEILKEGHNIKTKELEKENEEKKLYQLKK